VVKNVFTQYHSKAAVNLVSQKRDAINATLNEIQRMIEDGADFSGFNEPENLRVRKILKEG